eukprot:COSAG01_NODE_269_length_19814_cov_109.983720_21_plen_166_part_00
MASKLEAAAEIRAEMGALRSSGLRRGTAQHRCGLSIHPLPSVASTGQRVSPEAGVVDPLAGKATLPRSWSAPVTFRQTEGPRHQITQAAGGAGGGGGQEARTHCWHRSMEETARSCSTWRWSISQRSSAPSASRRSVSNSAASTDGCAAAAAAAALPCALTCAES